MRPNKFFILAATLLLTACGSDQPEDVVSARGAPKMTPVEAKESLDSVVEDYFEEYLELNPITATSIGDHRYDDQFPNSIGIAHMERVLAMHQKFLDRAQMIDQTALSGQDVLSYEIFVRQRRNAIEGFDYPGHLIPINQFFSVPNFFAMMGSGSSLQPFETVEDYENWLGRVDGFAQWAIQAKDNMRLGMERGVVQPTVLMERTLPQLQAQIVSDPEESVFYAPIRNMPAGFSSDDRERLTQDYRNAILSRIVPSYQALHDFIKHEYMRATRETVGLSALPNGDAWYAYNVRTITTTDLSPGEIHEIGKNEVTRIQNEIRKVMQTTGFEGTLQDFYDYLNTDPGFYYGSKEELIEGYRSLKADAHEKALSLFYALPDADYEIRAVEPFREKSSSGASYQAASPDGSRPGVFYVNTYDLSARPKWAMESLFLHEAVPGHHFQISAQRELEDLPRFRRFGGYTAYIEGWGLYAESLGKEMGVYQDPYQYVGALQAELWRAIRLVVDTGLHHKGWSREKVLDYMYANAAVKEARAVSEAERFIAIPGQALAYKVGQLKIRELRNRVEKALGSRFDVKEFHALILSDGALPLDVLEQKVLRYISDKTG
ncbi:MAG: DUF885 domain-containing protein [Gammaproteobacteria bacterium]|nr:DUF885 domain-containing protein [Gammaproteobacteria bacterium]